MVLKKFWGPLSSRKFERSHAFWCRHHVHSTVVRPFCKFGLIIVHILGGHDQVTPDYMEPSHVLMSIAMIFYQCKLKDRWSNSNI